MFSKSVVLKIQTKPVKIKKGDEVILICKSKSGYPKYLNVGDVGVVTNEELHHVDVDFTKTYTTGYTDNGVRINNRKMPRKILSTRKIIRDLIISDILK